MHILSAISALSFFALVLTAIAIARHVRSRRASTQPQRGFAHHLFAAAEDLASRSPRSLSQQSVKGVMTKNSSQAPRLQANAGNQSTTSKHF
jgi:hypothetical protein